MEMELRHLDEVGDLEVLVGTVHAVEIGARLGREHRREPVRDGCRARCAPSGNR